MEKKEPTRKITKDSVIESGRFLHLGEIRVDFKNRHTSYVVSIKVEIDNESYKSGRLDPKTSVEWPCNLYLSAQRAITITLRDEHRLSILPKRNRASTTVDLKACNARDNQTLNLSSSNHNISFVLTFLDSLPLKQVLSLLGEGMSSALESKVIFLNKIGKVSLFLQGVLDLGNSAAGSHPVAQAAFGTVGLVFQKCQQQQDCHKAALELLDAVVAKLPFADLIPENMQSIEIRDALEALLEVIRKIFIFLDKYASAPARDDFIMNRLGVIVDLKKRLYDASDNFAICVTSMQYVMVHTNMQQLNIEALEKLKPIVTAQYNRDQACLEGTREEILDGSDDWSKEIDPSLYWLVGLAGSGKSAIATTVCQRLRRRGVLAGSFFCKRDIPDQREPGHILPSLSQGLAIVHEPYRKCVLNVLETEPAIASAEMSLQLRLLFMEPIIQLSRSRHHSKGFAPFIFVIDALDECGDFRTRSQIAGHLVQLAGVCDWLKIFITSRPLPELHNKFDRPNCAYSKVLDLTTISAEDDIYQYTKHSLEEMASSQGLDDRWLTKEFIQLLSRKAAGLFIWTSTVMKYVEGQYDQDAAFTMILSGPIDGGPSMGLDNLYLKIIRGSRGGSDAANKTFMKAALGMIYITAKNKPLSFDALHEFMVMFDDGDKISKTTLRAVMNDLKSVLYEDSSKGNVIRVCHPSFLDFVAGRERSSEFWTDPEILDNVMARKCLTVMNRNLTFNICQLESSHLANQDINDLSDKIEKRLPETLQYSCSYWTDHIIRPDNEDQKLIESVYCSPKVLYWMEVLSLTRELHRCIPKLQVLLKVYQDSEPISLAVADAYRFMTLFHEPMSVSTPHIYTSAVMWLPEDSILAKQLHPHFVNQPVVVSGREKKWQSSLWVKNMGNWINEVVFSPDGTKVAAGSHDFTICIWDVKTGERTGLIIGNPSAVMCLAWSPDGNHIASGSSNYVLIWDAKTYMLSGEPLQGHSDAVLTVTYSPDGMYIASGAMDEAIYIWYAHTGVQAREPLRGHTDSAKSLAFSPNSKWLASGSDDRTIKIWDLASGSIVHQLEHSNWVNSVVFSHDGDLIASASHDYTIRIWKANTGELLGEPLRGHLNAVRSISFSQDDKTIASGSDDLTVCVWDVETGLLRGAPFRGHLHWITSVAFSPDGNYIVSGANDFTVRLWDVHTNAAVNQPTEERQGVACKGLDITRDGTRLVSGTEDGAIHIWDASTFTRLKTLFGHRAQINALKYSLDGRYIISASNDYTIRVWDAESGEILSILSRGDYLVNALSFSPDGKHFVSGAGDSKIRVWDLEKRQEAREPVDAHNETYVNALTYSSDGTLMASGGGDKIVNVWRVETMEQVGEPFVGHVDTVKAVVFSLDAEKLVSGSNDNTVRIWNTKTSEQLHLILGHTYWINCIALSPSGKHIVTAAGDTYARIWDLETGEGVGEYLQGHSSWVRNALYTPDGKSIISASDDSTLRVWDSEASQRNYVPEIDISLAYLSLDDGWVRGNEGQLILWIPPEQRNGLKDVCLKCIPDDALGHPVRLDWTKVVHGTSWSTILQEN